MRRLACLLLALLPGVTVRADEVSGGERLGTVHFAVDADGATRAQVEHGVKMLHHMMYPEADRDFAAVIARDPDCGFGYWGRAMALIHPLWADIPDAAELQRGRDFVAAGLARTLRSERERAYLGTMAALFAEAPARTLPDRLRAADAAWAAVAARFPDDLDAAAFSALYHLAPARFLPKDKSRRLQIEAVTILDAVTRQIPDHPGALHYKIHALDFPLLAGRALEVCAAYGDEAPDVPHALHMPTHIYTRLGLWDKSIEFNERSAEAARRLCRKDGNLNSHLPHALDYLAYAYLQRGQYRRADEVAREIAGLAGPYQLANRPAMAFAFATVPVRLALEKGDWAAASRLELRQPAAFPWGDKFLYCDANVRFGRALGMARSGDPAGARRELAELEILRDRIVAVIPGSYWAAQAEVQILTTQAWLALADGRNEEAEKTMRHAVEIEATTDKEAVTPGEARPAGELLGEMLESLGRPQDALAAFSAQLSVSPNRLNALAGAARAAEQAGDDAEAGRYHHLVLEVTAAADPGTPAVERARRYFSRPAATGTN